MAGQVTEWDEQGKPITPGASASPGVTEWDEKGTPITTVYANPQKTAQPAPATPQSSGASGSWQPDQTANNLRSQAQSRSQGMNPYGATPGSVGREAALGFGGEVQDPEVFSPSYNTPGEYMQAQVSKIKSPTMWDLTKTADPTGALATGEGMFDFARGAVKHITDIATSLYNKDWDRASNSAGGLIADFVLSKADALNEKARGIISPDEMSLRDKVQSARDQLAKNDLVDQARSQLVRSSVKPVLTAFTNKVRNQIDAHSEEIMKADGIDNIIKHQPLGLIDPQSAVQDARGVITKTATLNPKVDDFLNGEATQGLISLRELKSRMTTAWNTASSLKDSRLSAPLRTYWGSLAELGQKRANDLGLGADWQKYKNEARDLFALDAGNPDHAAGPMNGLVGKIQNASTSQAALEHLISDKNGGEYQFLKKKMEKYGIDTEGLDTARASALTLQDLTTKQANMFIGKVKAIRDHPISVGVPTAIASKLASKTGIPLASFAVPLIVAGKVSGLITERQAADLIKSIKPEPVEPQGPTAVGTPKPSEPPSPRQKMLPPAGSIQLGPVPPEAPPREPIQRGPERRQGYNPPDVERRGQDRRGAIGYGSPTNLETGTMEDIRKLKQDLNKGKISQADYNEEYRKLKLRAIDVARNPGDTKAVKMDIGKERQSAAEARTGERERKVAAIQEAEKRYGDRFKAPRGWRKGRRGWEPSPSGAD